MYTITLTSAKWYKAHDLYEVYVYGIRQILLIHNKRDKKKLSTRVRKYTLK